MMEIQKMAGLEVTPVSDGYDPFERQRALQELIYASHPGTLIQHGPAKTIGGLLARVRFNMEAIMVELVELLDHMPWKEWKLYPTDLSDSPDDHPDVVTEMKFEVVDVAHFLFNIALALDMDYDEFLAIFEAKQKENRRRQEERYGA